jgi:hypothetical protein
MLESLRQLGNILVRKQGNEIRGLGRITPKNLNGLLVLEDSRNLIAGEKYRDSTIVSGHPFHQLLLCMGVRSIDLV